MVPSAVCYRNWSQIQIQWPQLHFRSNSHSISNSDCIFITLHNVVPAKQQLIQLPNTYINMYTHIQWEYIFACKNLDRFYCTNSNSQSDRRVCCCLYVFWYFQTNCVDTLQAHRSIKENLVSRGSHIMALSLNLVTASAQSVSNKSKNVCVLIVGQHKTLETEAGEQHRLQTALFTPVLVLETTKTFKYRRWKILGCTSFSHTLTLQIVRLEVWSPAPAAHMLKPPLAGHSTLMVPFNATLM